MELRFWTDPETGLPHIYNHGVTEEEVRQVLARPGEEFPGSDTKRKASISPAPAEEKEMNKIKKTKQKYPPGWDEARVRKLAEHYDNQTDDEAVAEIEAALNDENQTLMMVPTELVPEIVKLINKKRPA